MTRELHDHYFHQARRDGYLARAAYKLIEIDERKRIMKPGDRVLDCGAAPGSWLQVAGSRVGEKGVAVGIDPRPVRLPAPLANVRVIEGDLRESPAEDLLAMLPAGREPRRFDVVLSDMAPDTTGDRTIDHHQSIRLCHLVLDRCGTVLRPGGHLVMKVFEGEAYRELLERAQAEFDAVKGFKPKASRAISREMYVIAHKYRGPSRDPEESPPAPPPPTRGW